MSETAEPPAKVLKIDNFDQELLIPDIESIGNGSTIPDGLGDAASVADGVVPDRLRHGDEDAEDTAETVDTDLTDAEDKETDEDITDPPQDTDKTEHDIKVATAETTDEIGEDSVDQELDKTGQDTKKLDQDVDKRDKVLDKLDQVLHKLDQGLDKLGQVLTNDQDASEGQEEWLSEGILTDDDFNANASTNNSEDDKVEYKEQLESRTLEQNIEETLNHLDGAVKYEGDEGIIDRKSNKNLIQQQEAPVKKEEDDGNDTDDLLRMLGEGDSKRTKKKLTKTVHDLRNAMNNVGASDDEDFVYDETSIRKLKLTKSSITKKSAPKAVPEDIHDGDDDYTDDQSSDEALATIKKSYNAKKTNIVTKKLPRETQNLVVVKKAATHRQSPGVSRRNIVNEKAVEKKSSSLIKPSSRSILKTSTPAKMIASKPNPDKNRIEFKPSTNIKTQTPLRAGNILKTIEIKKEEVDDNILDDEDYVMNDDIESENEDDLKRHQRIMKPERMDEEVPSDGDSWEEDGSLYDELPSSESDDMDDWFQIDIRAERATDYIPLLGSQAKELLTQEKQRTSIRVANLSKSLSALTESGKKQAEELRKATMALAELDDLLKAS